MKHTIEEFRQLKTQIDAGLANLRRHEERLTALEEEMNSSFENSKPMEAATLSELAGVKAYAPLLKTQIEDAKLAILPVAESLWFNFSDRGHLMKLGIHEGTAGSGAWRVIVRYEEVEA